MAATGFYGTERYEVLRMLGEGAMGAVYAARDVERGETVALKVLTHSDPRALLRFKTEYRSLQDLEHPNLVRLGELVEFEGRWFFSMEFVDGVELNTYIRHRESGYDEDRLRACFQQLARGIHALHAGGRIHRDIKPSNVLVARDGRVVLLDLGLVADTTAPERSTGGHVVGTAAYMSPEQAASRPLTPASDWYSFGTVLYEALTGGLPFDGSLIEMMVAKQSHVPASPGQLVPQVPADLDRLCVELLRFDPEQRPGGDDVLRRLGVDKSETHAERSWTTLTDSQVFVGRGRELEQLRASLDSAGEAPAPIFVHGPSGMGKTSLISRFVDELEAAHEDTLILRGRCYEHESVPFKAVDGVIDSLSRALLHLPKEVIDSVLPAEAPLLPTLFPVLGRVEAIACMERPRRSPADLHEVRQVAFRTLRRLLSRLARHRRLVISVDDFQWTDVDSVSLLRAVFGGATRPDILLILSSRNAEPPELFGARRGDEHPDWRRLEVGPLGVDDGAELARRMLAGASSQGRVDCVALAKEAQGHPLFIAELVRHAMTTGRDSAEPLELDEAICQRVRDLPAPARSVVELLSVAAAPLSLPTIEIAIGLAGEELARTLAMLRVVALTRSSSERPFRRVQPYHDRVREAVSGRLGEDAAAGYHLRLATALEADAGAPPEAVAFHACAAGLQDKAAEFFSRAADRAVAGLAFERAVSFYRRVLELAQLPPDETQSLYVRIAEALAHSGRGVEAAAEYKRAAEGANAAERVRLRNLSAIHLLRAGHVDEGLTALDEVLSSVNMSIPRSRSSAIPRFLLDRLRLTMGGYRCKLRDPSEIAPHDIIRVDALAGVAESLAWVDGIRAAGIGSRWLRAALRCGEREQVVRALCFEATFCSLAGPRRHNKTMRVLARAHDIAAELSRPELDLYVSTSEALIAQHEGRFADTYRLGRGVLDGYEAHPGRLPWEMATVRLVWLFGLLMTGRFREFVDTAEIMLRDADERRDRWFSSILRVLMAPWAALTRYDDPAEARALLDRGIEPWREREFGLIHFNWLNSAVWAETYTGNGRAGVELLERHRRDLFRSGSMQVQFLRIVIAGTDAAAHLAWYDESGEARALARVRRIIRKLRRERTSFAIGSASVLTGAIAMRNGDHETAVTHLAEGARHHRKAGLNGFATGSDWHRGRLLGGAEGAKLAADAEAFFEREQVANAPSFARCLGLPDPF